MKENVTYNLKKWEAAEALFTACFGTVWHFVYEWSGGNFLLGLFSPVNESVFEHLKLLLVPVFLFTLLEYGCLIKLRERLLLQKWKSMAAGMVFIIVFFYCYTGILKKDVAFMDIASFYGAVIGNSVLAYKLLKAPGKKEEQADEKKEKAFLGGLAWGVSLLLMVLGTLYPPVRLLPGLFLQQPL